MAVHHRQQVLSMYHQLLSLIQRLPPQQKQTAMQEAKQQLHSRKAEPDAQKVLDHVKEMAAKIGYLKIITPKRPGQVSGEAGRFVLRKGALVQGEGEDKGERCAGRSASAPPAHSLFYFLKASTSCA